MRARKVRRSATARRCIGPVSHHQQSRYAETRIETSMKNLCAVLLLSSLALSASGQPQADSLEKLADDFWAWRAKYAPFTGDDRNRRERPGGMRDWSQARIERRRKDLAGFEARWKKIDATHWPIPRQVDYRLIGSALSRVRWELDINPRWKRDPNFYIEQTLTPIAEAFLVPGPYEEARSREILTRIENIPSILQQGAANLDKPPAPFATVAIQALEKYQGALKEKLPSLPQQTSLGRDAYLFFLKNVAFYPYSPEELLAMGRQE